MKKTLLLITFFLLVGCDKLKMINADTDEMNKVAETYMSGNGAEKDIDRAFNWYMKSAEKGSIKAQKQVAEMYAKGTGVDKDLNKSFEWNLKAAEQGDADAQEAIGTSYASGDGVGKDIDKAFNWYMKSAEKGSIKAQKQLAEVYAKGVGVDKDLNKSFEWNLKAAKQGDADAQEVISALYASGDGVEKDLKKSIEWLTKAANQGDATSQMKLGIFYSKSEGVKMDLKKAFEWLSKAADQGDADAKKEKDFFETKLEMFGCGAMNQYMTTSKDANFLKYTVTARKIFLTLNMNPEDFTEYLNYWKAAFTTYTDQKKQNQFKNCIDSDWRDRVAKTIIDKKVHDLTISDDEKFEPEDSKATLAYVSKYTWGNLSMAGCKDNTTLLESNIIISYGRPSVIGGRSFYSKGIETAFSTDFPGMISLSENDKNSFTWEVVYRVKSNNKFMMSLLSEGAYTGTTTEKITLVSSKVLKINTNKKSIDLTKQIDNENISYTETQTEEYYERCEGYQHAFKATEMPIEFQGIWSESKEECQKHARTPNDVNVMKITATSIAQWGDVFKLNKVSDLSSEYLEAVFTGPNPEGDGDSQFNYNMKINDAGELIIGDTPPMTKCQ